MKGYLPSPVLSGWGGIYGFTWNDLQRLGGKGRLTFAGILQAKLPESVKDNIIRTIEFALEPPFLVKDPKGPTGQKWIEDPNQKTVQQEQRIGFTKI